MNYLTLVFVGQLIAFYPTWFWYLQRLFDRSDEPWSILALLTVLIFFWHEKQFAPNSIPGAKSGLCLLGLLLVSYVIASFYLPTLLCAVIAITCLGITSSSFLLGKRFHPGSLGLLILSLPIIASLQFYLGYPLRLFVTTTVSWFLNAAGFAVLSEGVNLNWQGHQLMIDVPCSGIKMLWSSLYLAFTLSCFYHLSPSKTVWLGIFSGTATFLGNVLRTCCLFFLEVLSPKLPFNLVSPEQIHSGIGTTVFLMIALVIAAGAKRLRQNSFSVGTPFYLPANTKPELTHKQLVFYLACCFLAASTALFSPQLYRHNSSSKSPAFSGWPTEFKGRALKQLPLSFTEKQFASNFPGHIARFTDGEQVLVMRWLNKPTRQLHAACDCFKGSGYTVKSTSIYKDAHGKHWKHFKAAQSTFELSVLESISDAAGNSWTDPSEWYWPAVFQKTSPPWLSITIINRQ